jgi:hypothetical protein
MSDGFDFGDPYFIPFYILIAIVFIISIFRLIKGKAKINADKISKLIESDLKNDKFRNGIRREDIYNYYSNDCDFNEEDFTNKVLPLLCENLK